MNPWYNAAIATSAITLFWMLAWPLLRGALTWPDMQDGAAIAANVALVSCLGLFYRPDRAKGFAVLAMILTALACIGFIASLVMFEGFIDVITKPRPH